MNDFRAVFKWKELDKPDATAPAITVWSPFEENTQYFDPSEKPFMFNYCVENLEVLLRVLREEGVPVVGEIQEYPYRNLGGFWIPKGTRLNSGNRKTMDFNR